MLEVDDSPDDGLSRFKRGWATGTAPAWLCGAVLDRERYADLAQALGSLADHTPQPEEAAKLLIERGRVERERLERMVALSRRSTTASIRSTSGVRTASFTPPWSAATSCA